MKNTANIDYTVFPVDTGTVAFHIDITVPKDVLDIAKLEKQIPRTLKKIAKEAKSFWDSEAGKNLSTSRVKYRESVSIDTPDNNTIVISMQPFAGMIETGGRKFDMKPGFLASDKVKTRFKIPRAMASTLPTAPIHAKFATKFLIIPMRYSQGGTKFRTVSDKSPMKSWIWKPKAGGKLAQGGVKLRDKVVQELEDKIIPEKMAEMIENVWSNS